MNFLMFKLVLEKTEEPEIKLPTSTGSWKKEYQSVLLFPSPEDLPNPEIKPGSPALQEDSLPSEPPGSPQQQDGAGCQIQTTHARVYALEKHFRLIQNIYKYRRLLIRAKPMIFIFESTAPGTEPDSWHQ